MRFLCSSLVRYNMRLHSVCFIYSDVDDGGSAGQRPRRSEGEKSGLADQGLPIANGKIGDLDLCFLEFALSNLASLTTTTLTIL